MKLLGFICCGLLAFPAETIDRIAVSIGSDKVITESELEVQMRLTAFLNSEKPDLSKQAKRETADRLVEQVLIRRELESSRYLNGAGKAATAEYEEFKKKFKTAAEYERALAQYEILDQDVRDSFTWQATLLDFIDMRFRPGIQISQFDIQDYYENTLLPDLPKSETPPTLESVSGKIEQILTEQRVDNALDRWLGAQRTQTRIRYRREVFP